MTYTFQYIVKKKKKKKLYKICKWNKNYWSRFLQEDAIFPFSLWNLLAVSEWNLFLHQVF